MKTKKCFKCNLEKSLSEYYKHKQMKDGHLNKCKDCTKKDASKRESILRDNPEWLEKERKRCRERIRKKQKYCSSYQKKYKNKYPEKRKAIVVSQRLLREKGEELHHWSYNEEHYKDVIPLTIEDHNLLHRFLVYDKETFYYRDLEGNLLDTKEKHLEYWYQIVENE